MPGCSMTVHEGFSIGVSVWLGKQFCPYSVESVPPLNVLYGDIEKASVGDCWSGHVDDPNNGSFDVTLTLVARDEYATILREEIVFALSKRVTYFTLIG